MADVSGILLSHDWQDAGVGNDLMGFGPATSFKWTGYDESGGPVAAAQRWQFVDFGGTSGIVAQRLNITDAVGDRYNIMVMPSGANGIDRSAYNRIIIDIEAAISQPVPPSITHFDIYMRPSGAGGNTMDGYRFLWQRRDPGVELDYIQLQHMVKNGGSSFVTGTHGDSKFYLDTPTDTLRLRAADDGTSLVLTVLHPASGIWEEVFRANTTFYNDHAYSGMFSTGHTNLTHNAEVNKFTIIGVSTPTPASGYVGGYTTAVVLANVSGYIGGYMPSARVRTLYANDTEMAGCWKFNESASLEDKVDSSSLGNDLDKIIGAPDHVAGKFDNAIQFKHWNEPYPRVARSNNDATNLSPTDTSWTMGGWINPSGGAYELYAHVAGKGYDQYVLYLDEDMEMWAQVRVDGIRYALHGGRVSGLTQDIWQHVDWVVDRVNGWHALYITPNDNIYTPILLDRQTIPSGTTVQDTSTEPFYFGASPMNQEPFDGKLDEWYFRLEALDTDQISEICALGWIAKATTDVSGYLGGYMNAIIPASVTAQSGYFGGYVLNAASSASGYFGGYLLNTQSVTAQSGYLGGYVLTPSPNSGYVGSYIKGHIAVSGFIGGYARISDIGSGAFLGRFDYFSSSPTLDFDAIARVGDANLMDFDATCTVRRTVTAPTTSCVVDGVSSVSGYEIMFSGVATVTDTTLLDGRSNMVDTAWINWGDFSGTMASVDPITGAWAAKHMYSSSGVYLPSIDVVDINGAHGSCKNKVDLSVGLNKPITLTLTGTPATGDRPLAVSFTNTYTTQFAGVKESVTYFGDRTHTHLNDPVHVYRYMGDFSAIWVVKDDGGRYWNDSLDVGVNT